MSLHLRSIDLDALLVGEGSHDASAHLGECEPCRERLARLAHECERLRSARPADAFLAQVVQREAGLRQVRRRRRGALAGSLVGLGAAAAVAAAWLLAVRAPPPETRLKGIGVEVYRKRGERVERLGADQRIRGGDGLRVSLALPAASEVSVSFVGADGRVDAFPGATGVTLGDGEHLLPEGVVVDAPCVDMRLVVEAAGTRVERMLRCE